MSRNFHNILITFKAGFRENSIDSELDFDYIGTRLHGESNVFLSRELILVDTCKQRDSSWIGLTNIRSE